MAFRGIGRYATYGAGQIHVRIVGGLLRRLASDESRRAHQDDPMPFGSGASAFAGALKYAVSFHVQECKSYAWQWPG